VSRSAGKAARAFRHHILATKGLGRTHQKGEGSKKGWHVKKKTVRIAKSKRLHLQGWGYAVTGEDFRGQE